MPLLSRWKSGTFWTTNVTQYKRMTCFKRSVDLWTHLGILFWIRVLDKLSVRSVYALVKPFYPFLKRVVFGIPFWTLLGLFTFKLRRGGETTPQWWPNQKSKTFFQAGRRPKKFCHFRPVYCLFSCLGCYSTKNIVDLPSRKWHNWNKGPLFVNFSCCISVAHDLAPNTMIWKLF